MIYHFNRIPTTSRCGKSFLILSMCCLLFPFIVNADADSMEYRAEAYRTYQSIEIDGEFNEEDWQNAKTITRLIQYEPVEGELISQPTEIRILYDAKEIYFGFTCFDDDISKSPITSVRYLAKNPCALESGAHVASSWSRIRLRPKFSPHVISSLLLKRSWLKGIPISAVQWLSLILVRHSQIASQA